MTKYIDIPASNEKATKKLHADTEARPASVSKTITIRPPNFGRVELTITGTDGPLVIHRFSSKLKKQMADKMATGKSAGSKKNRDPKDFEQEFNEARYRLPDGSDGFHAASIRNALISACRLVGYKMTLAKMSIFVEPDGFDKEEPQIPLIRIEGTPILQQDMARVETGQPYITTRAAYHNWSARVRLRWDMDQFTAEDVTNLLSRVGLQVGIGEGRPDSKNSAGMGWGLFTVSAATAPGKRSKSTAA